MLSPRKKINDHKIECLPDELQTKRKKKINALSDQDMAILYQTCKHLTKGKRTGENMKEALSGRRLLCNYSISKIQSVLQYWNICGHARIISKSLHLPKNDKTALGCMLLFFWCFLRNVSEYLV